MNQNSLFAGIAVKQPTPKLTAKEVIDKAKKPKQVRVVRTRVQDVEECYKRMDEYVTRLQHKRPDVVLELCKDEQRLNDYLQKIIQTGVLSLDTEGTGLNPIDDKLVGLCLYTEGETSLYVPVGHLNYPNIDATNFIKSIIDLSRNGKLKVLFANATFDLRYINNAYKGNEYIRPYWDCLIAGKFLNENDSSHALKWLWEKYCLGTPEKTIDPDNYKKLFGHLTFDILDPNRVYYYAAFDAWATYELYKFQLPFLDGVSEPCIEQDLVDTGYLFTQIEAPLTEAVASMEDTGVSIDIEYAHELSVKYTEQIDACFIELNELVSNLINPYLPQFKQEQPELYSKLNDPVNLDSPTQFNILLFKILKVDYLKVGLKKESVGKKELAKVGKAYPELNQMITKLLEYRGLKKLLGTYIDKLPNKSISPNTGRVHGKFNQYGADTGRFSSSDPNLQNIPSHNTDIRKMFIPKEGYYFIGADYSQIEPRLTAFLAQDPHMIEAYTTGKDLYSDMASKIYNLPYEECLEKFSPEAKQRRGYVKSVLLGILYGRGAASIAEQIKTSVDEAKDIINRFYETYPSIKVFEQQLQELVRQKGFVKTIWGRKRRLPDYNLPQFSITGQDPTLCESARNMLNQFNKWEARKRMPEIAQHFRVKIIDNGTAIAQAQRQILNSAIQGSSADITKVAILMLYRNERLRELGYKTLLTIHDEVIGEVPKENAKEALSIMVQIMKDAANIKLKMPIKCDGEINERWYGEDIQDEL